MTPNQTRTLFSPNPPQLDDPWLRAFLLVLSVLLGCLGLASLGS